MKDIREALNDSWQEHKRAVMATIVQVTGSAYRREGARCLVYDTGEVVGMISGGCVEGDLQEHAREVLQTRMPKIIDYDFRWDSDQLWGLGLGCNGMVKVWLQPLDPVDDRVNAQAWLEEFQNRATGDYPYFLAVVVESSQPGKLPLGTHWRMDEAQLAEKGIVSAKSGLHDSVIDGIQATLFVEHVTPRPKLVIFGAGADVVLLASQAKQLDWRICVTDHREAFLSSYFNVDERMLIPRGEYSQAAIDPRSYAVVMTHNLDLDYMAVKHLLPLKLPYLGVLGSRRRIGKIIDKILQAEERYDEDELNRIRCPIGLDIGAESPEEITLSIVSELLACKNGKNGGSMSRRAGQNE